MIGRDASGISVCDRKDLRVAIADEYCGAEDVRHLPTQGFDHVNISLATELLQRIKSKTAERAWRRPNPQMLNRLSFEQLFLSPGCCRAAGFQSSVTKDQTS